MRRLVELDPGHHEEADRHDDVVHGRHDRADGELPLEAEPDVDQDADQRDSDADRALACASSPETVGPTTSTRRKS